MYISGWAMTADAEKLADENAKIYNSKKHLLKKDIKVEVTHHYGHNKFSGQFKSKEAKQLIEKELCILMDQGNLCFGGECTISGDRFWGSVNID